MAQNRFLKKYFLTIVLCLFVLLFLIQRCGLIFFAPSHIAHPYFDESVSGVLPCDILDGNLRASLFAYEYLNRSGDVLIEGLLLVPYFKLLGRSIFSTKIFALTSSLLALIFWIVFIKKYQGLPAAIAFCAIYALPPPTFARLNLIGTISSHHMICPLIAAQSLLLFMILAPRNNQKVQIWIWFVSGLVAGFGVYIFYTYIIFLGFCLIFLVLFIRNPIGLAGLLSCAGGACIGFAPWLLRSYSSKTGGGYLTSLVKALSIDAWAFIQNFCFAVPHSLGYNYPLRSIGLISILFTLFILLCIGVIMKTCVAFKRQQGTPWLLTKNNIPSSLIQGLFCAFFPAFFLVCLSLSPMRIAPFEYWPTIGLFATFGEPDVIRYRWLYILFPFYFAAIAIAIACVAGRYGKQRQYTGILLAAVLFFSLYSAVKTIMLTSPSESGKIFYYTGYNYDQFAPKFILADFAPRAKMAIQSIVTGYPETYRGEAYRSYGTFIAAKALDNADSALAFERELEKIPRIFLNDFIYGVVRLAQSTPLQKLKPLADCLVRKYPHLFYRNWGFRHLGYKHYNALVNEAVLFANIPAAEQWFYKNFLDSFRRAMSMHSSEHRGEMLLDELHAIDVLYQADVLTGIGMLVGSEMLFDPLHCPDYPLDSSFGLTLRPESKEAFYQGVGVGFAETLCRYWRRLMPPDAGQPSKYIHGLEAEWQRCRSLMIKMPKDIYPLIKKGFKEELQSRNLNPHIVTFIKQHQNSL